MLNGFLQNRYTYIPRYRYKKLAGGPWYYTKYVDFVILN